MRKAASPPTLMATNPTWIEPPPSPQKKGLGCFAKGCLVIAILGLLFLLLSGGAGYFFFSRGKPIALPVEKISSEELSDVQQRVKQFKSAPAQPLPEPTQPEPTAAPVAEQPPQPPKRELRLTADEINGMISANRKAQGHAYVSMSGNTANVQVSIPATKLPGLPSGYLNGTFSITTDGPTSLEAIQVSKVKANGLPVPSDILSWGYRGRSLRGYALDALAPYNVSKAEIRDGILYAQ
jgi:hypothetical protein